jgi:hypothetical protein
MMPTAIDSLFVALELDPTQFTEGQKTAVDAFQKTTNEVESGAKKIETSGQSVSQVFDKMRNGAVEFFAVLTGSAGAADFLNKITNTNAQLGRLSFNMNMSVQQLAAWGNAAKVVGGDFDATVNSMHNISQGIAQFQATGQSDLLKWLRLFHIGLQGVNTPGDLLTALNSSPELQAQLANPATRKNAEWELGQMGLDPGTITLLERQPAALNKLLGQGASNAPTDKEIADAQSLQYSWNTLLETWTKVGTDIVDDITPDIIGLDTALTNLGDWFKANPVAEELLGIAGGLGALYVALKPIMAILTLMGFISKGAPAVANAAAPAAVDAAAGGGLGDLLGAGLGGIGRMILGPVGAWLGMTSPAETGTIDDLNKERATLGLPPVPGGSANSGSSAFGTIENPWGPSTTSGSSASSGASDAVIGYFTSRGYSPQTAAVIAAGLYSESKFDPSAMNPSSGATGVAQWLGSRLSTLRTTPNPGDLNTQLGLVDKELKGSYSDVLAAINNSPDPEAALGIFIQRYESPDPYGAQQDFISGSKVLPDYLKKATIPSPVGAAGAAGATGPSSRNTTNSSSTSVGSVNVHMAPGADANDIARNIGPAIQRNSFASQANFNLA